MARCKCKCPACWICKFPKSCTIANAPAFADFLNRTNNIADWKSTAPLVDEDTIRQHKTFGTWAEFVQNQTELQISTLSPANPIPTYPCDADWLFVARPETVTVGYTSGGDPITRDTVFVVDIVGDNTDPDSEIEVLYVDELHIRMGLGKHIVDAYPFPQESFGGSIHGDHAYIPVKAAEPKARRIKLQVVARYKEMYYGPGFPVSQTSDFIGYRIFEKTYTGDCRDATGSHALTQIDFGPDSFGGGATDKSFITAAASPYDVSVTFP
jgi:hypothetical protein